MSASESDIYTAISLHLQALQPSWTLTNYGVDQEPPKGPYQKIDFLQTPEPDFVGFGNGRFTRNARLVQISLHYPKGEKRIDLLLQRADLVRARFWAQHGLSIAAGDTTLDIEREPVIGPLVQAGASHNMVAVTVAFSTDRGPAG